ncbi:MAG: S-layer homology domain-containing protein [Clostridia bacterium]|nr:S-layer homology domain-containing protein [Clostridia bacterium]
MKKILIAISAALALVMLLPLASFAAKADADLPFSDVKTGKWYYENVKRIYDTKLMKGISETEFDPDGTLTRGMCATILYRVAGEPAVKEAAAFADVADGAYYADSVAWAKSEGVVNGKTATEFDPDGKITREEFAAMLYRFTDAADIELTETRGGEPADADKIDEYAADAVGTLYRSEVVNGKENGEFDPDSDITRAETSALLDRFLDVAHAEIRVVEEYGRTCVRIKFLSPDEEGEKKSTFDVTFEYIPEGLAFSEIDKGDYHPNYRLIEMGEINDIFDKCVVIYVFPTDEVNPGFSKPTWENVYPSGINGMDAFMIDDEFEIDGNPCSVRGIIFGDGDISIMMSGINISSEELIRVAENIVW